MDSITIKGSEFNTKLPGTTKNATHSMVIGVLRAAISHGIYDTYDAITGNFISHTDMYVLTGKTITIYNLLVADSSNEFWVGHCTSNKSKNFGTLQNYKNIVESSNVKQAYAW